MIVFCILGQEALKKNTKRTTVFSLSTCDNLFPSVVDTVNIRDPLFAIYGIVLLFLHPLFKIFSK